MKMESREVAKEEEEELSEPKLCVLRLCAQKQLMKMRRLDMNSPMTLSIQTLV